MDPQASLQVKISREIVGQVVMGSVSVGGVGNEWMDGAANAGYK